MIDKKSVRTLLNLVGFGFAIAGMIFVFVRLREHASSVDFSALSGESVALLVGLSVIYCSANLLLSLAWRDLLSYCGEDKSVLWAIRVYGLSQVVKYVPGNIFQFVGRQALGLASGVDGWVLVRSTAWELGLISMAGALFSTLLVSLYFREAPVVIILVPFSLILVVVFFAVSFFIDRRLAAAFAKQVFFLITSGGVFLACLFIVSDYSTFNANFAPLAIGAFVVAWLAGLVTPGAPAGLGVREAVLLLLLEGVGAEPVILMAVVLSRIVNVAGDLFFFGVASLVVRGQS